MATRKRTPPRRNKRKPATGLRGRSRPAPLGYHHWKTSDGHDVMISDRIPFELHHAVISMVEDNHPDDIKTKPVFRNHRLYYQTVVDTDIGKLVVSTDSEHDFETFVWRQGHPPPLNMH